MNALRNLLSLCGPEFILFTIILHGTRSFSDFEVYRECCMFFQKHKGVADPLEVVAGEISDEAILLCLDEFMVNYF